MKSLPRRRKSKYRAICDSRRNLDAGTILCLSKHLECVKRLTQMTPSQRGKGVTLRTAVGEATSERAALPLLPQAVAQRQTPPHPLGESPQRCC